MAKFARVFDRILDIGATLAAAMLIFSMLAVCAAITVRYFLNEPQTWVTDVAAIILLYFTFLTAAWLLRAEGHVKMELVISRLSQRHQSFLNIFTSVVGLAVFSVITFYGAKFTLMYYQMGYYMPTPLETPKFLIILIIPLGSILLVIQFLRRIRGYLRILSLRPGKETHE